MKFTSQICTTKEQSEQLVALGLKKETADCHYEGRKNRYEEWEVAVIGGCYYSWDYPAWSLHRLIEMTPIIVNPVRHLFVSNKSVEYQLSEGRTTHIFANENNVYDNVINCIDWLIKEGYFNKE